MRFVAHAACTAAGVFPVNDGVHAVGCSAVASPGAADGFVLRAAVGDLPEIKRRLERKYPVNAKHSVRPVLDATAFASLRMCAFGLLTRWRLSCFASLQRLKYTALHAAADSGHLDVAMLLVENGADVNSQRTVSAHEQRASHRSRAVFGDGTTLPLQVALVVHRCVCNNSST